MPTISHASRVDYSETVGVPTNTSLGTAVEAIAIGRAAWGPIAGETIDSVQQSYVTVGSWPEFKRVFGNFETNHPLAKYAWAFFQCRGQTLHVARTVHFTDPTDALTATSDRATYTFQYTSASATYGTVGPSTNTAPFFLDAGDTLDFSVDGGGTDTATFDAAAASVTDTTTYPVTGGTSTLSVKINQETDAQVITFAGTETTAAEIAATINDQIRRASAHVSGGQVVIESDRRGTGAYVQVTANPSGNPALTFPLTEAQGTGDVANIEAVTITEVTTVVEADVTGVTVIDNGDDTFSVRTDTSGSSGSIQVEATSTADTAFGLDNTVHAGTDTTAVNALTIDGKYDGTRGNNFTVAITAATSGSASEFDLLVYESSVVKERYFNLDYSTVESEVNTNSDLITATKLADYNPDVDSQDLTGGLDGLTSIADADYLGDQEAGTGIYAFDSLDTFRVALTDRETSAHVKNFMTYLSQTRQAIGILLYDIPSGNTYTQARTYMTSNGLKDYTYGEFGAAFWPYVNWPNPDRNIFGTTVDEVAFPASAAVAGRCAYVSAQRDAGFADEAANRGPGTLPDATSVTDDNVNKLWCRNLLYPDLINPIRGVKGTIYNDGVLCNKVDQNFPTIAQRITACETAQRILDLLDLMRHKGLSEAGYKERRRKIEAILKTITKAGGYASTIDSEAWRVDDSGNTPALARQLRYKVKVSIATIDPNEFTTFELGYNEHGLLYAELSV